MIDYTCEDKRTDILLWILDYTGCLKKNFPLWKLGMANITADKGTCQKRFSGFCLLRGYPPPTPLTDNHFAKKTVTDRGPKIVVF